MIEIEKLSKKWEWGVFITSITVMCAFFFVKGVQIIASESINFDMIPPRSPHFGDSLLEP